MARRGDNELRLRIVVDDKGVARFDSQFKKSMQDASKSTRNMARDFDRFGRNLQTMGRTLTRSVTLPIVGAAAAVVKFGGDFEKAMVQSTSIMGDLDDAMRQTMEKTAREVAKTTTISATQAAEAYYFLASAGMEAEAAVAALPLVAKFAQAGNFDMARATDLATDALSALGLAVDDPTQNLENLTRVTDVFARASVLANATIEQFSTAITQKAGTALNKFGQDVETGTAALALMADAGLKGEQAGTALTAMLENMAKGAINNADAWGKYNVELFDSEGNMRDLNDVVRNLEDSLGGMSDEQRTAALMQMGFNRQGLNAVSMLMGQSDALDTYRDALRDAGGTLDEVANKQMESLQARLGVLKDEFIDLAIEMYDVAEPIIKDTVIPALQDFASWLGRVTDWFSALDKETQMTYIKWAGAAAAAGPLLTVLGGLFRSLASVLYIVAAVQKSLAVGWMAKAALGFVNMTRAVVGLKAATLGAKAALLGVGVGLAALYVQQVRSTSEWQKNSAAVKEAARVAVQTGESQMTTWNKLKAPISAVLYEYERWKHRTDQQAKAEGALASAVRDGIRAKKEAEDATRSLGRAEVAHERAKLRITDAQEAFNAAVRKFGPDSRQAREAALDLKDAELDLADAARNVRDRQQEANAALKSLPKPHGGTMREWIDYYTRIGDAAGAAAARGTSAHTAQRTTGGRAIARARGTITSGPEFALIGEDGDEAVIPLSPKYRSEGLGLLAEAINRMAGSASSSQGSEAPRSTHITFNRPVRTYSETVRAIRDMERGLAW